ncbi:hypothetical protein IMZ48_10110 [Candidatus Bathyarchaeota archaeon]|nr:hypothetical protein [Candidatus Bathyarchaeota archaeon]
MSSNPSLETMPAELLSIVTSELAIEDVLACNGVSKTLRAKLADRIVAPSLIRTFFPGLPRSHTFSDFVTASHRYLRRREGYYETLTHHALDSNLDGTFSPDGGVHPYADRWSMPPGYAKPIVRDYRLGVIAWSIASCMLVVDDLHAGTRRGFDVRRWGFDENLNDRVKRFYEIRISESLVVI